LHHPGITPAGIGFASRAALGRMLSRWRDKARHRLTQSATTIAAMTTQAALKRFGFLAEALNGEGGFKPQVTWEKEVLSTTTQDGQQLTAIRRVPKLTDPCHLVPHKREGVENYAARCALAVYENHLADACDRYLAFLSRRRPMRGNVEAPLVKLLIENADMRGTKLDAFFFALAWQLKGRGSMLLLLDMPSDGADAPKSLADQIERRKVPFLRAIEPELIESYSVDDESGLFTSVTIKCVEEVDGKPEHCLRTWNAEEWRVKLGDRVIAEGEHPFRQCPLLAVTESGGMFPVVGRFAQIADMSCSIYNAASKLDELLNAQTFSIPTMQVTAEQAASFDANKMAVVLGAHNMLIYPGERPDFIAPDAAQAQVHRDVISDKLAAIKRVSMEESTADAGSTTESGIARRMRFERLNADLASFATQMQGLEQRMWALFHQGLDLPNKVQVEWPSDFNLIDTAVELDILALFQSTGMPDAVLQAKRETIVMAEFDASDDDTKAELQAALNEYAQQQPQAQQQPPTAPPGTAPATTP